MEQTQGTEKLIKLLRAGEEGEDEGEGGVSAIQESTATPDEMILLANCDLDEIIERNILLPRLAFYTEVCKIVLDTLRQNSKLLSQYNIVANNLFSFCHRFKSNKEYKKLADTLSSHYQQLIKAKKNPD